MRQMDVINPADISPVTIIGCGASGSAIGMVLAKMGGQSITLYDADLLERHNIPNQCYGPRYIGKNKAEALRDVIMDLTPEEIKPNVFANKRHYNRGDAVSGIAIMCVDSIPTRREIFEELQHSKRAEWIIDTRMASQFYEIYTIRTNNPDNIKEYAETFELEIEEAPCTDRSVIYTPMMMASRVVYYIKRISRNEPVPSHYLEDLSNVLFPIGTDYRIGEEPQPRRM